MPSRPRFKATLAQTLTDLQTCFSKWRAVSKWEIQHTTSNVPGQAMAAVTFVKGESRFRVSCNAYTTARENMRAVYLRIESARMDEVRGTATAEESLREYLQLPDGRVNNAGVLVHDDPDDPYAALGLLRGPFVTGDVVRAVYQARMRQAHPDAGGTNEAAAKVTKAYREIMAELGERP
jgi:hypothetical protein